MAAMMEPTISTTNPTARVRIHTEQKYNKWVHETTVELTFEYEGGRKHYDILSELLTDADRMGRTESGRRTALDAHALAEQEAK